MTTGPVRVLGLGSADRGDDGVGSAIARAVAARRLPDVEVVWPAEPLDLLDAGPDTSLVVVVDAVRSGAEPGTVRVLDLDVDVLPEWGGADSTHAVGLDAAVELARLLGRMPQRLFVVAVEAQQFVLGRTLSTVVRDAVEPAAAEVTRLVTAEVGRS